MIVTSGLKQLAMQAGRGSTGTMAGMRNSHGAACERTPPARFGVAQNSPRCQIKRWQLWQPLSRSVSIAP
jgi:hypothetical protein